MSLYDIHLARLRQWSRRVVNWAARPPAVTAIACEQRRLKRMPRHTPFRSPLLSMLSAKFPGPRAPSIDGPDAASFLAMAGDIFERQMYAFPCNGPSPRIIDVGANIGVGVLFFRAAHPGARILAFEADPALYAYLHRNVPASSAGSTELLNVAAWNQQTTLSFISEGADAGRVAGSGDNLSGQRIEVSAHRLRDYLDGPTDMLKIDIEGGEVLVLQDCIDRLHWVDRLFVEYHSMVHEPQQLHLLLALLFETGFRVVMEAATRDPQPLVTRAPYHGMDLQVNIFAYRAESDFVRKDPA